MWLLGYKLNQHRGQKDIHDTSVQLHMFFCPPCLCPNREAWMVSSTYKALAQVSQGLSFTPLTTSCSHVVHPFMDYQPEALFQYVIIMFSKTCSSEIVW